MQANASLPIESIHTPLLAALQKERNFVLEAPTGSGKSTQVPQFLLDSQCIPKDQVIYMLQPRRIAARMLARRIAWERGGKPGEEVGFHVRFDRVASAQTRLMLVTEGILLRKIFADPSLQGVGAILFDEFHERNLYSDLSLAMARQVQHQQRSDLILGVMSATLESDAIRNFLEPCAHLKCEGRTHPVEIHYTAPPNSRPPTPIWESAAQAFRQSVRSGETGNHLIFMPGAMEIHRTIRAIEAMPESKGFELHALHGELPPELQDAAIDPGKRPKVIVSTNVAETSLTIPGITVVIDSGLARIPTYDPRRGVNSLLVQPISQSSASQRAGRAGRDAPGTCIRLWSKSHHHQRPPHETPEILRVDLSETLLMLHASERVAVESFGWFEVPNPEQLQHAQTVLRDLGAISGSLPRITALGQRLAEFPMHPRYARLFIEASQRECLQLAAFTAAMLQDRSILLPLQHRNEMQIRLESLSDEETHDSDVLMELKAFLIAKQANFSTDRCRELGIHVGAARAAARASEQFLQIADRQGLAIEPLHRSDWFAFRKCLFLAFSDSLARRLDQGTLRCALAHGKKGTRRRESAVDAEWFVSLEMEERQVKGSVQVLLGRNSSVQPEWISQWFPDQIQTCETAYWDPWQKRVRQTRSVQFREIEMESKEIAEIDEEVAANLIAREVIEGRLKLKAWNHRVEAYIERINFVAHHFPEYEIAPITASDRITLLEQVCYGALTEKALQAVEILPTIQEWLRAEQQALMDDCAPEHLGTARGKLKVRYESTRAILSARIQQLYDLSPIKIAGRVPVVYEILAPNHRPVQVTDDLDAFWSTSYPAIKKELKGRYPKHEWR